MNPGPAALAPHQRVWLATLDEYARRYAHEYVCIGQFRDFVSSHADAAERHLAIGHLTGSAWLVSADGARALLTHHRKLNRWLQLGGHADGDHDLARAALREAQEESGLCDLVVEPTIFDLDCHEIPARGSETAHLHYDVRFVVHATTSEAFTLSDESHALAWRDIAALGSDSAVDASMGRMARKWLARTRGETA